MKNQYFSKLYENPIRMAAGAVVVLILCQLLIWMIRPLISELVDDESPWVVSVAVMFFYILFNAVSTFTDDNLVRHWSRSISGFVILAAAGYLVARWLTGMAPHEIDGLSSILLIVVIGFLVLRSIASTIMVVVWFTKWKDKKKRQDENM